jgi:hypothetical protein
MIIAYASGNADPINNPTEDPTPIDLSDGATSYSVTVYGDAEDTNDLSAVFTWAWTVLDPASGVTISDPASQTPTFTFNNDWRNIRVHLMATNVGTGESSESNILLSPTSSFCEIRVLSAERGLQKPAKGTRDWQGVLEVWADKIEEGASADIALNDLSDVTYAVGPALDVLVSGNDAIYQGATLHTHLGIHVDPASDTAQGTVLLEAPLSSSVIPKVLVQERLMYTQSAEFSMDPTFAGNLSDKIIFHSTSTSLLRPHVIFRADEEIKITHVSIVLLDAGTNAGSYAFQFCGNVVDTKVEQAIMPPDGATLTGTAPANYFPMTIDHEYTTPISVSAGNYFGLAVVASPDEADAGRSLRVTFRAVREIN